MQKIFNEEVFKNWQKISELRAIIMDQDFGKLLSYCRMSQKFQAVSDLLIIKIVYDVIDTSV